MADESLRRGTLMFSGVECSVRMSVQNGGQLTVEVEQHSTADQWHNTFDAKYIEDMTFKTGNFKKFSVFVEMLESAVMQVSDVVTLDLLTYADLELLKARKAPTAVVGTNTVSSAPNNSKKYLIVTYSVEYDRVHYPLPLLYVGKPDPRLLQNTIRQLQHDIGVLRQQNMKDCRQRELDTLRTDYDVLSEEKSSLEAELSECRQQLELMQCDNGVNKELRMLRGLVRSLQEQLTASQAKHQRLMMKRSQQCRLLIDELDDVKCRERSLKVRVKSLTNELAQLRRQGCRAFPSISSTSCRHTSRSLSRDRVTSRSGDTALMNHNNSSQRSSRNRSSDKNSSCLSKLSARNRDRSASYERRQTTSRGRMAVTRPTSRSRSGSRERSQTDDISKTVARMRVTSPASGSHHLPRFDPTAYKAERDRRRKEIELKRSRDVRLRMSGSADRDRHRHNSSRERSSQHITYNGHRRKTSRSPSVGSIRSLVSSVESLSDDAALRSDSELHRLVDNGHESLMTSSDHWTAGRHKARKKHNKQRPNVLCSTPESVVRRRSALHHDQQQPSDDLADVVNGHGDRSAELSEIDERLSRLQQFMKENLS